MSRLVLDAGAFVAFDGDTVPTSDPDDIARLLRAAGRGSALKAC